MASICAIIARKRHRKVVEEMAAAGKLGVGMVELRFDFLQRAVRIADLLKRRRTAAIVTFRRQRDGGLWSASEDERLALLRAASLDGADWIDVEEDVAHLVNRRAGAAKRLVSYHNFVRVPEDLADIQRRMENLDADAVKIACLAHSATQALRVLELLRTARVPTIALAMGEWGLATRVLGAKFGSPWSYAATSAERLVAPGLLTVETMRETYRYEAIDAATEVYGVLGDPVAQSLGPLVHNAAFAKLGMNKVYLPFRVAKDDFKPFLEAAAWLSPRGFSVTIPHKQAAAALGRPGDDAVRRTFAANTLLRRETGWESRNTDVAAAVDAVHAVLPIDPESGMRSISDRATLVLGAGGVARAVAYGLRERGAMVTVAARKREDAKRVAELVGCRSIEWEERYRELYDVIVNCTPVGMAPNLEGSAFHGGSLKPNMTVFDTVYNPENTALVREARARGCGIATGVDMFVGQAEEQFRLFAGAEPPPGLMARLVREALSPARAMLREVRLAEDAAAVPIAPQAEGGGA